MRFKSSPLFWFIVAGLATWRITSIIQREEIASPIRKQLGVFEPDGEDPDHWIYPDNFIGKVLHCFWCGSVWAGLAVSIALVIFPPLLLPLALSAISIVIYKWIQHLDDSTVWIESTEEEEGED